MPTRFLLLDLDQTLHDKQASDAAIATRQFHEARLAERGIELEGWTERFVRAHAIPGVKAAVFDQLAAEFALTAQVGHALYDDFERRYGETCRPVPGAAELLRAARTVGCRMGIVTNGRDAFQRAKIAALGFTGLVDAVVTSGGCGFRKPDPAIFQLALRTLDADVASTVMVGDDHALDVEPAAAFGLRAVWKSPERSPVAVFNSDSLEEIRKFLLPTE